MTKINLIAFIVLSLFASSALCGCSYRYADSQYLPGCFNGCIDYATVAQAQNACDQNGGCAGVTYSFARVGGGNSRNNIGNGWGYQLRAGANATKSPNSENSWVKEQCPAVQTPNKPCDFQPRQGTYLGGCVQNCKDFPNLAAAQAACRQDPQCGGVTFSRKNIGGSAATNAFDGVWGFQLRASQSFSESPNGENSWLKVQCPPCGYNYADGLYLPGCYNDCIDYATVAQAQLACNQSDDCGGVTYSFAGVGGSKSKNNIGNGWGYQLRAGRNAAKSPNSENSWVKTQCPAVVQPLKTCEFQPKQGTYLGGCVQNCKDFPTLADAVDACRQDSTCGGVTFSRKNIGGSSATNAFDGVWGYQLRASQQFSDSPNGENSWLKTDCPPCNYNYADGQYLPGCFNDCIDYSTVARAQWSCNANEGCGGVTYSYSGVGGSKSRNNIGNGWGYQLRAGRNPIKSPNSENSWAKGQCPAVAQPLKPCDFQPRQGTYLGGCVQNCKDFPNLAAAQAACRQDPQCGGVTFSRRNIGGNAATNAFDGVWGYQLRASQQFSDSPNGENSWLKVQCPPCTYNYADSQYLPGCFNDCIDYATVAQAQLQCNQSDDCGGVTYSYAGVGGSKSKNNIGNGWGYQLRAGRNPIKSPNSENSWAKAQCPAVDQPLNPCDFQPRQGTYLGGCVQNCKDFPTLAAAEAACRNDQSCGGVTFSRRNIGGNAATNAFDGVWGFQLRSARQFSDSPNGENSWLKVQCAKMFNEKKSKKNSIKHKLKANN